MNCVNSSEDHIGSPLLLGDEERGIAIPNKGAFSSLFAATFDKEKNGGENQ